MKKLEKSSTFLFLVITLFLSAFQQVELASLAAILFVAWLVPLIVSLMAFLQDLNVSLAALELELESDMEDAEKK